MSAERIQNDLIQMSRELGREERRLAILGEGNTSADIGDGTFWVKASGSCLATMTAEGLSRVSMDKVLALVEGPEMDNATVGRHLRATLVPPSQKQPSVEAFLHALCLTIGRAKWVGHTHTDSVLQILCSKAGAEPFRRHIFPDEIVVCGRHVGVIPYVDPGLQLARTIRDELNRFKAEHGRGPKVLLMVNHGPVALGQTPAEVLNIMLMLDKWARVLIGTQAMGGPNYFSEREADHLDNRPDEAYRRKQLAG